MTGTEDLTERNAAFAASGFDADLTINPSNSLSLSSGEFSATDQGWTGDSSGENGDTFFKGNRDYPRYPAETMVMGEWLNTLAHTIIQCQRHTY
jgi:hypothetical protein